MLNVGVIRSLVVSQLKNEFCGDDFLINQRRKFLDVENLTVLS